MKFLNKIIAKIKYKIDNLVLRKTWIIMFLLIFITVIIVLIVSIIANLNIEEKLDSIATLINAWFPYASEEIEENSTSVLNNVFIVKMIASIVGLFLTSVLIGTITEGIGIWLGEIRKGKSRVIEKKHIVVLGYDFENHKLIKELIYSFEENKTILIVDEHSVDEIEDNLHNNIDIPKNVKIVIRTMRPWDVNELKKCNLEGSAVIIITPLNDICTIKAVFAVKKIIDHTTLTNTHVVCAINDESLYINFSDKNYVMVKANELLSKLIAMSNKQTGLPTALLSIFSFKGSEFYLQANSSLIGKSFIYLINNMIDGVPVGINRNNNIILLPNLDEEIKSGDEILYYSQCKKYEISTVENCYRIIHTKKCLNTSEDQNVLIMGFNNKINTILNNFDENVKKIVFACENEEKLDLLNSIKLSEKKIKSDFIILNKTKTYFELQQILKSINHIILLSDEYMDRETSDVTNMHWYIKLVKIREQFNLKFTILAELFIDENRKLLEQRYSNDFIVSTNIVSMFLAQMAMSPMLKSFLDELLTCSGVGIDLYKPSDFGIINGYIGELRFNLYNAGYILLGYVKKNKKEYVYCPRIDSYIEFEKDDALILLSDFTKRK